MHHKKRSVWCVAIAASLALTGLFAAAVEGGQEQGKIPITTSSATAREHYLNGLNLSDKLRALEAREHFQKATEDDPKMAIAYLNLAFTVGTAKGFFENLQKAASLAGQASEGERLWILGAEAGANGFTSKQQQYFEKLVAAYPNDERAHNLLGNNLFGLQEWEKAVQEYTKAIQINPNYSQPYNQMGYAYRFLEKYDEAEKAFKKYIQLIPDDPNPYDSYAELLMKVGRYDESIENYRKALSVDPHFVASRIGIATDYNFKGDYASARKELQKLYDSARDDGERRAALFGMCVSYAEEGDLKKSVGEQEKAFAIAEKLGDSAAMAGDLNTMGQIQLEMGQPDEALKRFERSWDIMSKSNLSAEVKENAKRNHLFNIAQVDLMKKNLAGAKAKADEYRNQVMAVKNQFQIWQAHQLDGMIAMEEKDYVRAIASFEKSNLQNAQNLYRLAMAYKAKGEQNRSAETLKNVAQFNALNSLNYAFVRKSSGGPVSADTKHH